MQSYGMSVYLGLGSNLHGLWGAPYECLERAADVLEEKNIKISITSGHYESPALGLGMQPLFVNRVFSVSTDLSPGALLRQLKWIEYAAGRRRGAHWGARPLDIDILDYRGQVLNWKGGRATQGASALILPHPELEKRAFVLKPLCEIAPNWRHPALHATASQLLASLEPEMRSTTRPVPKVRGIT